MSNKPCCVQYKITSYLMDGLVKAMWSKQMISGGDFVDKVSIGKTFWIDHYEIIPICGYKIKITNSQSITMSTEEQILEWKKKAEKWDALGKKIESCYGKENKETGEFQEYDDDDEDSGDLLTIGQYAAHAFGWINPCMIGTGIIKFS